MILFFLVGLSCIASLYDASLCPENCHSGSCCERGLNDMKCCPYVNGVCCSNSNTCCPQGSECVDRLGKCKYVNGYMSNIVKLINPNELQKPIPEPQMDPIDVSSTSDKFQLTNRESYIMCEDRRSACPSNSTCCKLGNSWGCCSHPEAVCCSDGKHCCPANTRCNDGTCEPIEVPNQEPDVFLSNLRSSYMNPELTLSSHSIICADKKSKCPSETTCCLGSEKKWECCPMPAAVCCSDGKHCCPNGYTCDLKHQSCVQSTANVVWMQAVSPPKKVKADRVRCSRDFACPNGSTCCKTSSSAWACCPLPKAVCCSDGIHCCPNGTVCDQKRGLCNFTTNASHRPFETPKRSSELNIAGGKVCTGGLFYCPTGTTCCESASGGQSCCPYEEAVCCGDGLHCCPKGSRCDNNLGTCVGTKSLPWLSKIPARREQQVPTIENAAETALKRCSPDRRSHCPVSGTCCPSGNGSYSCCSEPNAVCCPDHQHCCPAGTECASGKCIKPSEAVIDSSSHRTLSLSLGTNSTDVLCPDGKSHCSKAHTCCSHGDKHTGCCSMPNAVCCDEGGRLCCPENTVCDVSRSECIRKLKHPPPVIRKPFKMHPSDKIGSTSYTGHLPANSARPGAIQHAAFCGDACGHDSWSCCPDAEGNPQSMCCPINGGVCCPGGKFCCPVGTQCSSDYTRCEQIVDPILRSIALPVVPNRDLVHARRPILVPVYLAKADVFLYYPYYRLLKQSRRNICHKGPWYCPLGLKCCPVANTGRYVCIPPEIQCP